MAVVALFPTLILWYLSVKVLASSEKKKKKDRLLKTSVNAHDPDFFCHKNADKEPCTSTERQNSPSIPSAFEASK